MASSVNINAGKGSLDHVRLIDMTLDLSASEIDVDSYATGGFDLPAALDAEIPQGISTRSIAVKAGGSTHYAKWNDATRKVQVYSDVNFATEISAATDLNAVTDLALVMFGY